MADRIEKLKELYGDEEFFQECLDADPTNTKQYAQWLMIGCRKGRILVEDLYKADDLLLNFDAAKNARLLPADKRDIGKCKTLGDLAVLLADINPNDESKRQKKLGEKARRRQDVRVIVDDPAFGRILQPLSVDAARYLGQNTQWCTANTNHDTNWKYYSKKGPLYVVIEPDGTRWQLHPATAQWADIHDRMQPMEIWRVGPLAERFRQEVDLYSQSNVDMRCFGELTLEQFEARLMFASGYDLPNVGVGNSRRHHNSAMYAAAVAAYEIDELGFGHSLYEIARRTRGSLRGRAGPTSTLLDKNPVIIFLKFMHDAMDAEDPALVRQQARERKGLPSFAGFLPNSYQAQLPPRFLKGLDRISDCDLPQSRRPEPEYAAGTTKVVRGKRVRTGSNADRPTGFRHRRKRRR